MTKQLTKLRLKDDGTVKLSYIEKRDTPNGIETITHESDCEGQRSPDLDAVANELKPYVLMNMGITALAEQLSRNILKKDKLSVSEKSIKDNTVDPFLKRTEIVSVSVSGQDGLRGAVISAKFKGLNDSFCAVSTPRICYESDKLGFEEDVEDIMRRLEAEAFRYLSGKRAQLEFNFESNEEPASEEVAA